MFVHKLVPFSSPLEFVQPTEVYTTNNKMTNSVQKPVNESVLHLHVKAVPQHIQKFANLSGRFTVTRV